MRNGTTLRTLSVWVPAVALFLSAGAGRTQTAPATPSPTATPPDRPAPGRGGIDGAGPPAPVPAPEGSSLERSRDRILVESLDLIEREYVEAGVTREELIEAALRGMVDHLNRRAAAQGNAGVNAVLTRRDVANLKQSMAGRVTGIGVLARASEDGIEVLRVFPDSPAGKAGLRSGDRILAVDDTAVAGTDAFNLLRGRDGVPVRLSVTRDAGTPAQSTLELKLVRAPYQVSTVVSRVLDEEVGYLRISAFTRGSSEDAAGALLAFREQGLWGVVLDLRGNGGGSLDEATRVAGMFIDPGQPLVQIQTRAGDPQTISAAGEVLWSSPLPVTVLVDGGTASAAEALASALQTSERGLLIGERTAGRGLGESVFQLPTGGALRLATARYADANGLPWLRKGLLPDTPVAAVSLEPNDDPQLRTALTIMGRFRSSALPRIDMTPIRQQR